MLDWLSSPFSEKLFSNKLCSSLPFFIWSGEYFFRTFLVGSKISNSLWLEFRLWGEFLKWVCPVITLEWRIFLLKEWNNRFRPLISTEISKHLEKVLAIKKIQGIKKKSERSSNKNSSWSPTRSSFSLLLKT